MLDAAEQDAESKRWNFLEWKQKRRYREAYRRDSSIDRSRQKQVINYSIQ